MHKILRLPTCLMVFSLHKQIIKLCILINIHSITSEYEYEHGSENECTNIMVTKTICCRRC